MSAPWNLIMTTVCDFNTSKQKPMNLCENSGVSLVAESSTSEHESVTGYKVKDKPIRMSDSSKESSVIKKTGYEEQVKIFPKKDALGKFHHPNPEDSARKLQAMNKKLDVELNKDGKVQLAELATMVRALKKEMEIAEAVELDASRDSLCCMVKEGSSLRSLLESLEVKLDTFLTQKPEDNKASTVKTVKRGYELQTEGGVPSEGTAEENNKADFLRTKSCRAALHAAEQLTLAVEEVYKDKAFQSRALNKMATSSGGTDAVSVSNSESCAKILTSGEKIRSSIEKVEPNNLPKGKVAAAMSQAAAGLTESSFPEFSIRNFVSTARNKDMNINWPFSRRSLKLCLKSGVKNVLPSFQSFDSVQNNLTTHVLAKTVSSAERSRLDQNPCWLKNHPVSGSYYGGFDQKSALLCTDSNSTPSGPPPGNQDFVLETTAHSQSEMESVSTSKIPLSEASDKQGAAGSAVRQKTKSSSTSVPNKKRKLVVKVGDSVNRGTAEDIASTRSLPPETAAQKTCPVCGNFSSSSNTTLNAHIDQCLSVEPTSEWMKSSQTVKPRIKPRKIRLMSDICATAPCCTIEELDIRNGRVPVADADLGSHTNNSTESRSQRDSIRHVKGNGDECAVYVDANGTKIRILSKANDASPILKGLKDLKKKSLKKGKGSNFLPSNQKHLAKCLKVSEAYPNKACVGEKANFTVGGKHQEKELPPSFEIHEQNKVIESGNSVPNLLGARTVLSEKNCIKRRRGRPKGKVRDTRDLLAVSRKSSPNSNIYKHIEKSSTMKTIFNSVPNNIKRDRFCKAVIDENIKSMNSVPFSVKNQFTRENIVPEDSDATQIHSPDEEGDVDANDVEQNELLGDSTEILLKDSMEADAIDHDDKNELNGTTSSAKLPPGELDTSLCNSSDPELHKLNHSGSESNLLQFPGNLFGSASAIHLSQDIDIHGMFNEDIDIEQGVSFPLVDTISIPGPPGSYLPSFRDPCFEYLQGSSSLPNRWVQSGSTAANPDLRASESDLGASVMAVVEDKNSLNSKAIEIGEHLPYASVKSACMSPPVLRLLGKDVMVFSNHENATAKCNKT